MLAPEEVARAGRFAFEHLVCSYLVSQGALRLMLAHYLNRPPREIQIVSGPKGKPALRRRCGLHFNMSHSGELAMYAFARNCELGVDVEKMRLVPDLNQIASEYFSKEESAQLRSLPAGRARDEAFFRCWTRKEAYLKAIGDGLAAPLDDFEVTLLPEDPVKFVHIGKDAEEAARWTLHHLDPAENYVGAVAYCAPARAVVLHEPVDAEQFLVRSGGASGG